jgi:hypothetical protein
MTEARLHEGARLRVEWLTGRTQDFIDFGRNLGNILFIGSTISAFSLQSLLTARFAFASRCGRAAAGAFALQPP